MSKLPEDSSVCFNTKTLPVPDEGYHDVLSKVFSMPKWQLVPKAADVQLGLMIKRC